MASSAERFSILVTRRQVEPFVEQIILAADQDKDALGFFASGVFREFASSEQLFVAVEECEGQKKYAGHLMFKCSGSKAKVLQIFISPIYRKRHLAKMLLDALKASLTELGFISMYARVAEDLREANSFWKSQGFYVQGVVAGGNTRKRTILVRSHELDSPQLFATSGRSSINPLGLATNEGSEIPMFLLDLNVLFDLGPRRPRNEDALDLFRAERLGVCRFAISSELSVELKRTATLGKSDPMQAYARIFPVFPLLSVEGSEGLSKTLASIVFPNKDDSQLSENDKSDLGHLATAIQHRLAGLITNDESILGAAAVIKKQYDVQVVSPATFKQSNLLDMDDGVFSTASTETLELLQANDADGQTIQALLLRLGLSGSAIASHWAIVSSDGHVFTRYGVWSKGQLIGYMAMPNWASGEIIKARIAIDESTSQSANAARILISCFLQRLESVGTAQVRIEFPLHQAHIREAASNVGFCAMQSDQSTAALAKIVLGCVVTAENWQRCKQSLVSASGVKLPDSAPVYSHPDQHIPVHTPDGNRVYLEWDTLETLLAPSLFCLPGRDAVITPVRREFSEHLLNHLPQRSLLPQFTAALHKEKHYLSDPKTLKFFKRGV